MNTRKEIADDFEKEIVKKNHICVYRTKYVAIVKKNQVDISSYAYNIEKSKYAVIFLIYSYTVVTQEDMSTFVLFLDDKGRIDSKLVIDGWEIKFNDPITFGARSYGRDLTVSKENLSFRLYSHTDCENLVEWFAKMWKYIVQAMSCKTQTEIKMIQDLVEKDEKIDKLENDIIEEKWENYQNEELIKNYKNLLNRIEEIVNKQNNL
jgi:hypothetical protein